MPEGLRVSEIVNVKLEDLKLEIGHVLVRGKGDKERIVPIGNARAGANKRISGDGREALLNGQDLIHAFCAPRRGTADAAARLADGKRRFRFWTPRQPAHAAA